MAMTNHERVGKALELLRAGLAPFVERELKGTYGARAAAEATRLLGEDRLNAKKPLIEWDAAALLRVMWEAWYEVFRKTLGQAERSLLSELREWRNKWAHQEPFSTDDAYRALDSAARLLSAVSAREADEVERMKLELLRVRYDEQVRGEKRKAGGSLIEVGASAALKPWREVVSPHLKVAREIERRVREDVRDKGDFSHVHPFPQSGADVQDDLDARLVVLSTSAPHTKDETSPALAAARGILEARGNAPRLYRNTLVFLAADRTRLQDLEDAVRGYLAWDGIIANAEALLLDPQQRRQAEEQRRAADSVVAARLPETYQWLLVPVQVDESGQPDPKAGVTWHPIRLQGNDPLAVRASKRLRNEELLLSAFAGTRLRMELDRIPLWRGDHVDIRQLVEDFARYLYLPRLRDPAVLVGAVRDGVALLTWEQETFAYADSFDEAAGRYRGLRAARVVALPPEPCGMLVKPEVARRQLEAEAAVPGQGGGVPQPTQETSLTGAVGGQTATVTPEAGPALAPPRRFHGSATLDPLRAGADAGKIAQEVIAHLTGLPGARVRVTLEIEATVPGGIPDQVVRTVTENCRTLKFSSHGFESD